MKPLGDNMEKKGDAVKYSLLPVAAGRRGLKEFSV